MRKLYTNTGTFLINTIDTLSTLNTNETKRAHGTTVFQHWHYNYYLFVDAVDTLTAIM